MKQIKGLILILLLLICSSSSTVHVNIVKIPALSSEAIVYICTGSQSKKYHKTDKCYGLSKCSGSIVKKKESIAIKEGRTKCKICYK